MLSRRRGTAGFAIFTLVMVAAFVGLGIWQLQRRAEKHALIAALERTACGRTRGVAAAVAMECADAGQRRIPPRQFCRDLCSRALDAMVYSAPAPPCVTMSPAPAPGLSCPRGCPAERPSRSMPDSCRIRCRTAASRIARWRGLLPVSLSTLTGYIRFPETAGVLTPAEDHRQAAVVHPRSSCHGARAGLGEGGKCRAVLHRPGNRRCLKAAFRNRARSPCI